MSKLIYFKGICTLSIVWEAGPVVLSNYKNMWCINWTRWYWYHFWIRHTNLCATRRYWDPFGIVIQYNRNKTYAIDEDEIEDQSINDDDFFSIHHALQEGNKLSPSVFLEKRKSLEPNIFMVLFMPYKICIFRIYASKALGG
jgi:hypothetical protein